MKKILPIIITLLGFVLIFAACEKHGDGVAENTCPYALMHGGVTYYYTGEAIPEKIKVTEDALLGRVTSVIPETAMPSVSGQANIDILGASYMHYPSATDGIIVLIDGEWVIFERRDGDKKRGCFHRAYSRKCRGRRVIRRMQSELCSAFFFALLLLCFNILLNASKTLDTHLFKVL